MSDERDLEQRVRSAISRVPVTEHPLAAQRARHRFSGFLAVGATLVILIAAIAAGQWLATYRAGSAASCGSLDPGISPQARNPIRTIRLDQRWTIDGVGTLCIAGIRVYDGVFDIVSYEQGTASWAEPWTSAGSGLSLGILTDDRGRIFAGSSSSGFVNGSTGNVRISEYQGFIGGGQDGHGDLLAGVHELHYRVQRVLDPVTGPWRFDGITATRGGITAISIMSGREMRITDLVLRPDGFSVAYLPLGEVTTGTVVMSDPLAATDDRGTTYAFAGVERIGSSPNLYAKFTPAPPPGAVLSIQIPKIYVASDRTWEGTLTLSAGSAASARPSQIASPTTAASTSPATAADVLRANGLIIVNPQGGPNGPQPYLRTERDPTPLAEFSSGYYRQFQGTASPDGTKLAYWSYASSNTGLPMELRILDTSRPAQPRTLLTLTNEHGERPLWSADGNGLLIPVTDEKSGQGVVAEYCALRSVDLVTGAVRELGRVQRAWLLPTYFDHVSGLARAFEQDYSSGAVIATWEFTPSAPAKRTLAQPKMLPTAYSADGSLSLSASGTQPSPLVITVSETSDPQRTYAFPADPSRPIVKGWGFRPNSNEVYVWRMDANGLQLVLWEPRTGVVHTVDATELGSFRPDGSAVVTSSGLVLDIATGKTTQIPGLPPGGFIGALARLL